MDLEFENNNNEEQELEFNPNEFKTEKYESKTVEELVDVESGSLVDREKLTPMDYIKALAKKLDHQIKDPKKNCKFCYGRGHVNYIAPGSNDIPVPCRCIYTKEAREAEDKMPRTMNREQKRKLDKMSKKITERYRKILKNKGHEEVKQKETENDN